MLSANGPATSTAPHHNAFATSRRGKVDWARVAKSAFRQRQGNSNSDEHNNPQDNHNFRNNSSDIYHSGTIGTRETSNSTQTNSGGSLFERISFPTTNNNARGTALRETKAARMENDQGRSSDRGRAGRREGAFKTRGRGGRDYAHGGSGRGGKGGRGGGGGGRAVGTRRGHSGHASESEDTHAVSQTVDDPPGGRLVDEERATWNRRARESPSTELYNRMKLARVLERSNAIAQGIIDDPLKPKRLEDAIDFVGTCMDMCSEYERVERTVQNLIDPIEIDPAVGEVSRKTGVKRFQRPAAGNDAQLPSDVRPPKVLVSTLHYLMNTVLLSPSPWRGKHPFLRDRTRAIRQDFTLQNYRKVENTYCHEVIARFHIFSLHRMAEERDFSSQQEMEQLQKTLTTLSELYEDARLDGEPYPNEAEFRAYQLLTHIRDPDLQRQAQRWPPDIFNSTPVKLALQFFMLVQANNRQTTQFQDQNAESCLHNFGTFFRLVASKRVSYLVACLLESHFSEIRKTALKAMKGVYRNNSKIVYLKDIQTILGYEDEESVKADCDRYGLQYAREVQSQESPWYLVVQKGSTSWTETAPTRQSFHHRLVESKLGNRSLPDVIYHKTKGMLGEMESAVPSPPGFQNAPGTQAIAMSGELGGSRAAPTAPLDSTPSWPQQPATSGLYDLANSEPEQMPPADVSGVVHPAKHDLGVIPSRSSSPATAPGPPGRSTGTAAGGGSPSGPLFNVPAVPNAHESPTFPPIASYTNDQPLIPQPSHAAKAPNSYGRSAFLSPVPPTNGQPALASRSSSSPSAAFESNSITPTAPQLQPQLGQSLLAPASATISNQLPASPRPESVFASTTNQLPVSSRPGSAFAVTPNKLPGQPLPASAFANTANQVPAPSRPVSAFAITPNQPPGPSPPASVFANTASQLPVSSHPEPAFAITPNKPPGRSLPASAFANTENQLPAPSHPVSAFAITPNQPPGPPLPASVFANTANQRPVLPPTLDNPPASPFAFWPPSPTPPVVSPPPFSDSGSGFGHPTGLSWGSTVASIGTAYAAGSVSNIDSPRPQVQESQSIPASAPGFNPASVSTNGPNTDGASRREDGPRLSEPPVASLPEPTRVGHSKLKQLLRSPVVVSEIANKMIDSVVTREVKKIIQDFRQHQMSSICEAIANDYYPLQEKSLSVALTRDLIAENCYGRRLVERIFYPWKRRGRKLLAKRRRTERLRNPLKPVPRQWQPVYYPDSRGPDREKYEYINLAFKAPPLADIFHPKVKYAYWPTSGSHRRWRLLMASTNTQDQGNFWWKNKFLGQGMPASADSELGSFEAQFELDRNDPTQAKEVGGFIFGCSASYHLSNQERFAMDKKNLHDAITYLSAESEFEKLAVMVVCYRSPLDTDDADPFGGDSDRVSGDGRQKRLVAIREALGLGEFGDRIIGREVILVETFKDVDFAPAMTRLSNLVMETVNPKVARLMTPTLKPEPAKRKPDPQPMFRNLVPERMERGSKIEEFEPTTQGKRRKLSPKSEQAARNRGVHTKHFNYQARGLHLDWEKFSLPNGGTLSDGVTNPVGEKILVTTTRTPKRSPPIRKGLSALEKLTLQVQSMIEPMRAVSQSYEESTAIMREMRESLAARSSPRL